MSKMVMVRDKDGYNHVVYEGMSTNPRKIRTWEEYRTVASTNRLNRKKLDRKNRRQSKLNGIALDIAMICMVFAGVEGSAWIPFCAVAIILLMWVYVDRHPYEEAGDEY